MSEQCKGCGNCECGKATPVKSLFEMTEEERKAVRDANPPEVSGLHHANMYFDWGWKGCGFGQLSFSFDRETSKLECMNECMSRDSVRKILHSMADFIADRAILLDNEDDIPPIDIVTEIKQATEEYDAYLASKGTTRKELFGE
jgi:hypothetical protein